VTAKGFLIKTKPGDSSEGSQHPAFTSRVGFSIGSIAKRSGADRDIDAGHVFMI
jgi:hypothetical protein